MYGPIRVMKSPNGGRFGNRLPASVALLTGNEDIPIITIATLLYKNVLDNIGTLALKQEFY